MNRVLIGVLLPIVGTLGGYGLSGGKMAHLLHAAELMIILSFIGGGITMAYGWTDLSTMFRNAIDSGKYSRQRLEKNILICEGASKFSIYGGFTACFLGILITMTRIGDDVALIWMSFSAAMTGLVMGAGIAGVVFQPLKFRFMNLLNQMDNAQGRETESADE